MTQFSFLRCIVLTVVSLSLVAGCDQPTKKRGAKRPKKVATENLPELGDHFGPLDGGRLEVAPPVDWHIPPRNSKFVARFQQSEEGAYPSIIITAEDTGGSSTVSKKNVNSFAKETAARMKKEKSAAKTAHTVLPVEVGSFVGVIYKRRGRAPFGFKKIVVDRLIVETVVDGRKYVIELRAREGDAQRYQPHLLAVVGGLKFLDPSSAGVSGPDMSGGKSLDDALEAAAQKPPAAEPEKKEPEKKEPEKKEPEKKEPEKKEPEKKEPEKKEPEKKEPEKKEPEKKEA